jgi:hypothetical protein
MIDVKIAQRYCPTKTNRGLEWYQSKAYDLPLFQWIFFFNLKGLHSLKSKNVFSALTGTSGFPVNFAKQRGPPK